MTLGELDSYITDHYIESPDLESTCMTLGHMAFRGGVSVNFLPEGLYLKVMPIITLWTARHPWLIPWENIEFEKKGFLFSGYKYKIVPQNMKFVVYRDLHEKFKEYIEVPSDL